MKNFIVLKNLIIYMPTNDCEIVKTAENYFGKENVINASLIE